MSRQLVLALPDRTRDEAKRRGLDCDETIEERDQRVVGILGAAVANLNYLCEQAADAGFEVVLTTFHQDRARGPRVALVRGRIRRLAVNARV